QQEALELANCADIVTTGGSVNALLQLKHLPLDTSPGECVPSIHRSRDRVHSVSTATCAFTIYGAGSPSAYPLAFPEAWASETIPHGPHLRWTSAPGERWRARWRESAGSVTPFLEAVWRCVEGRTMRRGTCGMPSVSATAWKCTKTGKMKMWHFSGIKFAMGLAEETHNPLPSHEIRRKRTRRQNFSLDTKEKITHF